MILAYFTPEVALPLTSAIAAAVGFVMLVGRAPLRLAARVFRFLSGGLVSAVAFCTRAPLSVAARGCRSASSGFKSVLDKLNI